MGGKAAPAVFTTENVILRHGRAWPGQGRAWRAVL